MKKTNKLKISVILNAIIAIFTMIACFLMFTGIKFMHGYEPVLESTKLGMFRFFTVDSNVFMGITAIIYLYYVYQMLKKKIEEIPSFIYLLKFMATAGVSLTFFVVFTYLGPISPHGISEMLMNSNLFFHLLIPVISIISFIFFENEKSMTFKKTFYGLLPMAIYGLYYIINILIHTENGIVSPKYDWYWFVQNGVSTAIIVFPIMFLIDYGICLFLWGIHSKLSV